MVLTMVRSSSRFSAHGSKKQALVVIAALAPMLTGMTWTLVVNSTYPFGIKLFFATMLGVFGLILVGPIHRLFARGPMVEVGEEGFRWRGWSDETITWDAVERWKLTNYLGMRYVSVWLCEPERHRATTAARWTQWANGWFGHGDISVSSGGLNRPFEELASAFGQFAPKPPLPKDARSARRRQGARNRADASDS